MLVKMFEGVHEILLFRTNDAGEGIGEKPFFKDRDRDDYNVSLVEFPIVIQAALKSEAEREHS